MKQMIIRRTPLLLALSSSLYNCLRLIHSGGSDLSLTPTNSGRPEPANKSPAADASADQPRSKPSLSSWTHATKTDSSLENVLADIAGLISVWPGGGAMPVNRLVISLSGPSKIAVSKQGKGIEGFLRSHPAVFKVERYQTGADKGKLFVHLLDKDLGNRGKIEVIPGDIRITVPPLPTYDRATYRWIPEPYTPPPFPQRVLSPDQPVFLRQSPPTLNKIEEVLRYVPSEWTNISKVSLPKPVQYACMGLNITKTHWCSYQPRYFDLRHDPATDHAEMRRSPMLHPKENGMTPEQAAEYVRVKLEELRLGVPAVLRQMRHADGIARPKKPMS